MIQAPGQSAQRRPAANQPRPLPPGHRVGRFKIERVCHRGHDAIVYRAREPQSGQLVALKQLLPTDVDDPTPPTERLAVERRIHAALTPDDQVHLIRMVDISDEHTHAAWVAYEWVDGPSLEQVLHRKRDGLAVRRALGILAATASALNSLHRHGVQHRDLKPSNILLPRTGGLKLGDFGLAVGDEAATAMRVGSVRYMAPERLRGDPADARADLYSLGLIGFEMLAGRDAFERVFVPRDRDEQREALRWLRWHTNERAAAPRLSECKPDLDEGLVELIARLLEKDPAKRLGSAQDVLTAVGRLRQTIDGGRGPVPETATEPLWLSPQAASASQGDGPPPGSSESLAARTAPLPTPRRFHRGWWLAAAILLVAVGVGGLVVNHQAQRVAARQQAETRLIDAIDQFRGGDWAEAEATLRALEANWSDKTTFGTTARAGLLAVRGMRALEDDDYEQAYPLLQEARELDRADRFQLEDALRKAADLATFRLATQAIKQHIADGRLEAAQADLDALQSLVLSPAQRDELRSLYADLAARRTQIKSEQIVERAHELVAQGRLSGAIALLRESLNQMHTRQLQSLHESLVQRQRFEEAANRGLAEEAAGNLTEALIAYERALRARDDPAIAQRVNELRSRIAYERGIELLQQGQTAAARQALTRSLSLHENSAARQALERLTSADRAETLAAAAEQALREGEYAAAAGLYERLLADRLTDGWNNDSRARSGQGYALRTQLAVARALAALQAGRIDDATTALRQLRELDPTHPRLPEIEEQLGARREYQQLLAAGDEARDNGDFGRAKERYLAAQRVLDTPEVRALLDDTEYEHLLAQARGYIALNELDGAKALLRSAEQIRPSDQVRTILAELEASTGTESSD